MKLRLELVDLTTKIQGVTLIEEEEENQEVPAVLQEEICVLVCFGFVAVAVRFSV